MSVAAGSAGTFGRNVRRWLPEGLPIGDDLWHSRHRVVVWLLAAHIVGLAVYGVIRDTPLVHLSWELGAIAVIMVAAARVRRRWLQASLGTLGLVTCSGLLVHLSGGLIEAHFHFFIIVVLVTLYQSWTPFLLCLVFVVVHHGSVGVADPTSVYNHAAAINAPWTWALIHGLFIAGASGAALAAWKHTESERTRAEQSAVELHERGMRERSALQLNDTIVQSLAVAAYAAQRGHREDADAAVDRSLALAKQLVADLMAGDPAALEPGALRRDTPAQATSPT